MPGMPPAALWLRRASQIGALLLLVPLVPAALVSARLATCSWLIGGMLPDPIVAWIGGDVPASETEERLETASRRIPGDFRFPFRQGRRLWERRRGADGAAALVRAHSLFVQAADLAPTYAPCRLHLFWTSLALGEAELADEQARAALALAPLSEVVRRPLGRYFLDRYRASKSKDDLLSAFRALSAADEEPILAFLDDPLLSFEDLAGGLGVSRLTPEAVLPLLRRSSRWDWAKRLARESDAGRGTHVLEAEVRIEYCEYLLVVGAIESAAEEAEAALELLGDEFGRWLVLGRARLRIGRAASGLEALGRALETGTEAPEVRNALAEGDLAPGRRAEFWRPYAAQGAPPATRLELGRALVDAGRAVDSEDVLRSLLDDQRVGGEAHYLLARTFLMSGERRIALRHAREACLRDPDREAYRELRRELEKAER
jgi:tetratricopeptide (TPR) repeat protein